MGQGQRAQWRNFFANKLSKKEPPEKKQGEVINNETESSSSIRVLYKLIKDAFQFIGRTK